mgnify:CR=1 FL=1
MALLESGFPPGPKDVVIDGKYLKVQKTKMELNSKKEPRIVAIVLSSTSQLRPPKAFGKEWTYGTPAGIQTVIQQGDTFEFVSVPGSRIVPVNKLPPKNELVPVNKLFNDEDADFSIWNELAYHWVPLKLEAQKMIKKATGKDLDLLKDLLDVLTKIDQLS